MPTLLLAVTTLVASGLAQQDVAVGQDACGNLVLNSTTSAAVMVNGVNILASLGGYDNFTAAMVTRLAANHEALVRQMTQIGELQNASLAAMEGQLARAQAQIDELSDENSALRTTTSAPATTTTQTSSTGGGSGGSSSSGGTAAYGIPTIIFGHEYQAQTVSFPWDIPYEQQLVVVEIVARNFFFGRTATNSYVDVYTDPSRMAFPALKTIRANVWINVGLMRKITNFGFASMFPVLEHIEGSLRIDQYAYIGGNRLTAILPTAFPVLSEVHGELTIGSSNPAYGLNNLETIEGAFQNLTKVYRLSICGNNRLGSFAMSGRNNYLPALECAYIPTYAGCPDGAGGTSQRPIFEPELANCFDSL